MYSEVEGHLEHSYMLLLASVLLHTNFLPLNILTIATKTEREGMLETQQIQVHRPSLKKGSGVRFAENFEPTSFFLPHKFRVSDTGHVLFSSFKFHSKVLCFKFKFRSHVSSYTLKFQVSCFKFRSHVSSFTVKFQVFHLCKLSVLHWMI